MSLITLKILIILPALVPALEALPALANYAAYPALFPSSLSFPIIGSQIHPISGIKDTVAITSSQKKNPSQYPSFT